MNDVENKLGHHQQLIPVPSSLSLYCLENFHAINGETSYNERGDFEFLWIRNGTGTVNIEDREYTLISETIYIISPGQMRRLHGEGVTGFVIRICPQFLHLLRYQKGVSVLSFLAPGQHVEPVRLQNEHITVELLDLTRVMQKEIAATHAIKYESLKSMLMIFLIYLSYEFDENKKEVEAEKGEATVNRFLQLLNERVSSMKQVNDYASELNVTANYLNIVVKRFTGYNASQHIQQFVIMEAKRQVICSGLRMKEVADHLGFSDCAHFSKYFKTYTGVTFSNFRNSITRNAYQQ